MGIVRDTALIFECGGTRASYTAGVVVTLLEEGIEFLDVYGISARSMLVKNTTIGAALLRESYRLGYEQARGELSAWRNFL
jgi:predicted patatin/cPLA2 family phospholipase